MMFVLAIPSTGLSGEERRLKKERAKKEIPTEVKGRGGLEPTRYGDWEVKGITSDF